MKERLRDEWEEYVLLLRSIPSIVLAAFVISVIVMNLAANKSIALNVDWLALDCGIFISWLSFLTMDILVRRFGPKAATEVSITACALNLVVCVVFYLISIVPGSWGESFIETGGEFVNIGLDNTFGGTWYVLLGSTIAFIVSALINNTINWAIGVRLKHHDDNFFTYALRSYVSTLIAQFGDNMIFSLIVSVNFFGWTLTQCLMCSLTGCLIELICEVVFSPIGYRVSKNWKSEDVGKNYLEYINRKNLVKEETL